MSRFSESDTDFEDEISILNEKQGFIPVPKKFDEGVKQNSREDPESQIGIAADFRETIYKSNHKVPEIQTVMKYAQKLDIEDQLIIDMKHFGIEYVGDDPNPVGYEDKEPLNGDTSPIIRHNISPIYMDNKYFRASSPPRDPVFKDKHYEPVLLSNFNEYKDIDPKKQLFEVEEPLILPPGYRFYYGEPPRNHCSTLQKFDETPPRNYCSTLQKLDETQLILDKDDLMEFKFKSPPIRVKSKPKKLKKKKTIEVVSIPAVTEKKPEKVMEASNVEKRRKKVCDKFIEQFGIDSPIKAPESSSAQFQKVEQNKANNSSIKPFDTKKNFKKREHKSQKKK